MDKHSRVRAYVARRYSNRNGRQVRISHLGEVTLVIDGNGTQMDHGKDRSGGRIFDGWLPELIVSARRERYGS